MFPGLTSRWTFPCRWAAASPAAAWDPIRSTSSTASGPAASSLSWRVFRSDVPRLDVAVDLPLPVGGRQSGGGLGPDPQHLLDRQRAGRVELVLEGLPI